MLHQGFSTIFKHYTFVGTGTRLKLINILLSAYYPFLGKKHVWSGRRVACRVATNRCCVAPRAVCISYYRVENPCLALWNTRPYRLYSMNYLSADINNTNLNYFTVFGDSCSYYWDSLNLAGPSNKGYGISPRNVRFLPAHICNVICYVV